MLSWYTMNEFKLELKATIWVEFATGSVEVDGKTINLGHGWTLPTPFFEPVGVTNQTEPPN